MTDTERGEEAGQNTRADEHLQARGSVPVGRLERHGITDTGREEEASQNTKAMTDELYVRSCVAQQTAVT